MLFSSQIHCDGSCFFFSPQFLEHRVLWLEDLFILLKNSDASVHWRDSVMNNPTKSEGWVHISCLPWKCDSQPPTCKSGAKSKPTSCTHHVTQDYKFWWSFTVEKFSEAMKCITSAVNWSGWSSEKTVTSTVVPKQVVAYTNNRNCALNGEVFISEIFHIYRCRYEGEYKDNQHGQQGIRKIRHIAISKEEL